MRWASLLHYQSFRCKHDYTWFLLSNFISRGWGGTFLCYLTNICVLFFQILPKRLDWEGSEHNQSFDEVVSVLTPQNLKIYQILNFEIFRFFQFYFPVPCLQFPVPSRMYPILFALTLPSFYHGLSSFHFLKCKSQFFWELCIQNFSFSILVSRELSLSFLVPLHALRFPSLPSPKSWLTRGSSFSPFPSLLQTPQFIKQLITNQMSASYDVILFFCFYFCEEMMQILKFVSSPLNASQGPWKNGNSKFKDFLSAFMAAFSLPLPLFLALCTMQTVPILKDFLLWKSFKSLFPLPHLLENCLSMMRLA